MGARYHRLMQYIEAVSPTDKAEGPKVFLAGGITGVKNWQAKARRILQPLPFGSMLNPRRADFPIHDPDAAEEQITWEFNALTASDWVLFWFEEKEIQPIALYELGRYAAMGKNLVVGTHPDYPRFQDVHIQMELARPELKIWDTLEDTCNYLKLRLQGEIG